MRIMLTVLDERGDRDVVVEGEPGTTVARLAEALSEENEEPPANVVRLTRSRAPYGFEREPHSLRSFSPAQQSQAKAPPRLWRDGRTLDPRAPARVLLHDGDRPGRPC